MNKLLTYITAAWIAAGATSCKKEIDIDVTFPSRVVDTVYVKDTIWNILEEQQKTLDWHGQQIAHLDSIQNEQGQTIEKFQEMLDGYFTRLDVIEKKLALLDGYEDLKWEVKELQAEVLYMRDQIWDRSKLEQVMYVLTGNSGNGSILERVAALESQMKEIEKSNKTDNPETWGNYPLEIQDAFNWAYEHGFTSKKTIEEFWPYWTITRKDFFTLINHFARHYWFHEVARNGENPQWIMNKAQVLTCIWRVMYGDLEVEKWDLYYKPYVDALQQDWIIKKTDDLYGYYPKGFIVLLLKKVAATA